MQQQVIDTANAGFWDELCGTTLAKNLGIVDSSPVNLKKFDDWYFDFYSYLLSYIQPEKLKGQRVLEIGLGYGSVAQKLLEAGVEYTGLDIAQGPVNMIKHRMGHLGIFGKAMQESYLDCSIPSHSMDVVISIGCFHHTGNIQRCIDQTHRILKPGGRAVFMVYNVFSLRRWVLWPKSTFQAFLYQKNLIEQKNIVGQVERKAYDPNSSGDGCPHTDFSSIEQLEKMCHQFKKKDFYKENFDSIGYHLIGKFPRWMLLNTFGKMAGLDIYCVLQK